MEEPTLNRLLGGVLMLISLPFLWIEVGRGVGKVVSFGAGALFGFSAVLLVTGQLLWDWGNE